MLLITRVRLVVELAATAFTQPCEISSLNTEGYTIMIHIRDIWRSEMRSLKERK